MAVHFEHEISARISKFKGHLTECDMVSQGSAFTFLGLVDSVCSCEKGVKQKHAQKECRLGTSCLRRLETGNMAT